MPITTDSAISSPRALYFPSSRKNAFRSCRSVMKANAGYLSQDMGTRQRKSKGGQDRLGGGDRPVEVPLRVRQGDEPRLELGRREVDPAGEHPVEPCRVPFRVALLRRGVVRHRALL